MNATGESAVRVPARKCLCAQGLFVKILLPARGVAVQ
jgi:hypothetical protein